MKAKIKHIDGEYWFTAKYTAELLATTRKTVEAMAVRELVRSIPDNLTFMIAEVDVTSLRRDPQLLADAKKAAKMPRVPARSEPMPIGTIYKGDRPKPAVKTAGRIGNPLADERHS